MNLLAINQENSRMIVEQLKTSRKRNVLVGIRFDGHSKELLDWALVKVAHPGDCVVAVHVCQYSGTWALLNC